MIKKIQRTTLSLDVMFDLIVSSQIIWYRFKTKFFFFNESKFTKLWVAMSCKGEKTEASKILSRGNARDFAGSSHLSCLQLQLVSPGYGEEIPQLAQQVAWCINYASMASCSLMEVRKGVIGGVASGVAC